MHRALGMLAFVSGAAVFGCGNDAASESAPSASTSPAATTSAAAKAATAHHPASAAPSARPTRLEVLRFRLTSNVEHKEPVDDLVSASPGERVWGHATIRNRTQETKHITLVFRVDGDERTTVDLKVEPSWSWRTYGYVTLREADKEGVLTVELRDEHAELLDQKALTIRPRAGR